MEIRWSYDCLIFFKGICFTGKTTSLYWIRALVPVWYQGICNHYPDDAAMLGTYQHNGWAEHHCFIHDWHLWLFCNSLTWSQYLAHTTLSLFGSTPAKLNQLLWKQPSIWHLVLINWEHLLCRLWFMSSWWVQMNWWLTHWGRDKMAAILQTTFWNTFSWMKMYEFWLQFHWMLFLRVQLTIFHHWFR